MRTHTFLKIILTLPVIVLCSFFVTQLDKGFVGSDGFLRVGETSYNKVVYTEVSIGWYESKLDYRILNSKGDTIHYYGNETFKHDNDIFEQKYLIVGILFVVCCGLTVVFSIMKMGFSSVSYLKTYYTCTLLQSIFLLGVFITSWIIVAMSFKDEDFESSCDMTHNNKIDYFRLNRKGEDILSVKWVPILSLVLVVYWISSEILIYASHSKKKKTGDNIVEVQINNV